MQKKKEKRLLPHPITTKGGCNLANYWRAAYHASKQKCKAEPYKLRHASYVDGKTKVGYLCEE